MDCLGETIDGKVAARYWPGTHPELIDTLSPEGLVAKEGCDDCRDAGAQTCGCCAHTTMMDNRGHSGEQPAVWKGANHADRLG